MEIDLTEPIEPVPVPLKLGGLPGGMTKAQSHKSGVPSMK